MVNKLIVIILLYIFSAFTAISSLSYIRSDTIIYGQVPNYITLTIECNKDTINMNDIFEVTLIFQNNTYRYLKFYPYSDIKIIARENIENVKEITYYSLNSDSRLDEYILNPKNEYKVTYRVKISDLFFKEGDIYIYIIYSIPNLESKEKKLLNNESRHLYSQELKLLIK